jgi:hypothetical protein
MTGQAKDWSSNEETEAVMLGMQFATLSTCLRMIREDPSPAESIEYLTQLVERRYDEWKAKRLLDQTLPPLPTPPKET